MSVCWIEKEGLIPIVGEKLKQVDIVLDIGCGINPQKYVRPMVHICCEPFEQYVEHLRKQVLNQYDRNYVILRAGWADAVKLFPAESVDSVFLIDVIEHLEKTEALRLLRETEKIVRKQTVIFTPLGFLPQSHPDGKDAWGFDGGAWQEHKSGWYPEDFDDSWDVYASKEFHATDNLGRPLEEPGGAFWAIKAVNGVGSENREAISRKENIQALVGSAIDISPSIIVKLFVWAMRLTGKCTTSKCGKLIVSSLRKIESVSGIK